MNKTTLLVAVSLTALVVGAGAQTTTSTSAARTPPPEDLSKWFSLLLATEGGGGLGANPQRQPSAYGGVKLGASWWTLDLGYDRVESNNGFSAEFSAMLPVFRFPRPQSNPSRNYVRLYAEPGFGRRFGDGFHGYSSAKVMIALLSDDRIARYTWSPYIELQHRFPLNTFGSGGDTRIAIGVMLPLCTHCGLD